MRDPEVRCPDCDTSNVWFAEVCTSCGTALAGTGLGSSGAIGGPVSSQLPRNPTKTCPICGILNDDLGRFCTSCGTALAGTGIGNSGPVGEEVSSQLPEDPSKICPSCGILNDDLGRFCTSCGTALAGTGLGSSGPVGEGVSSQLSGGPSKTCPGCGILNEGLRRFCVSCGASLTWPSLEGTEEKAEAGISSGLAKAFEEVTGFLSLIYAVLVGIHVYNNLGWWTSFKAPINDVKLAVNCPTEVKLLWEFINRDPFFDEFLRTASESGESLIPWLCQTGSLY